MIQHEDSQKQIACERAAKNSSKVIVGLEQTDVLDLLGEPTKRFTGEWVYSFYASIPSPTAGQQIVIGVAIIFEDGKVKEIKYAAICATGPGQRMSAKK